MNRCLLYVYILASIFFTGQCQTTFSEDSGINGQMLNDLKKNLHGESGSINKFIFTFR